ncbi:hypothetical protein [Clostridium sp. JN-1]|uniref:hypothetical protein n=1 Tax=Clostridium sp. JN-1 TaxID=2483110 RepID=UPI001237900C|nr:hypothetical protein [Clostridium sp. JN-1]
MYKKRTYRNISLEYNFSRRKLGSKIEEKEERKILLNKKGQLNGSREVKVLFQEQYGIWLNIQGKENRKNKLPTRT